MLYRVYYMTPKVFRDLSFGDVLPQKESLDKTHVFVREVEAHDMNQVFTIQQAHNWADDWKAINRLLETKGLRHTSMSVGDVIENTRTGEFYVVAPIGFTLLV